jgi:hypothetical protein
MSKWRSARALEILLLPLWMPSTGTVRYRIQAFRATIPRNRFRVRRSPINAWLVGNKRLIIAQTDIARDRIQSLAQIRSDYRLSEAKLTDDPIDLVKTHDRDEFISGSVVANREHRDHQVANRHLNLVPHQ